METPTKVTPAQFQRLLDSYIIRRTRQEGDKTVCATCGTEIRVATGYMSLHDRRFAGCVGWGEVMEVPVPFCPSCEAQPSECGCIHTRAERETHIELRRPPWWKRIAMSIGC